MNWLEQKYIGIISNRLEKFKRKSSTLYNFLCPLCTSNSKSARGYFYEKEGKSLFHCHNCGKTMSIINFIKTFDFNIYNEYLIENLKELHAPNKKEHDEFVGKMKPPVFMKEGILRGLKKVSQLTYNNPVKTFVASRKIPNPYHAKLFSCPNFMHFANTIIPNKFKEDALSMDETRLLIPYINKEQKVHAFNGRSLKKSQVKYIKIIVDDTIPNIYGLDTVDFNQMTYVMEGEIDSMFIKNSIATGGGDLVSAIHSFPKEKMIICYDNEKRSAETIKKLDKAIINGYSVCIWPNHIEQKDINNMILDDMSSDYIEYLIKNNTFSGIAAKTALSQWRKL